MSAPVLTLPATLPANNAKELEAASNARFAVAGSEEKTALQAKYGWDTGCVVYGATMSESTAKLSAAGELLSGKKEAYNFPFDKVTIAQMDFMTSPWR
jgi:hypothetical protein